MKENLPKQVSSLILGNSLVPFDIGKSRSEVFKVALQNGAPGFLKISSAPYVLSEIKQEIAVLNWLALKIEVPKPILFFEHDGVGYFLMTAIEGFNLAEACKTLSPSECLQIGARYLRKIHSISIGECPFSRNLKIAIGFAEKNLAAGLVDETDFDSSRSGWTGREVCEYLLSRIPKEKESLVFTHGDYCLPNIICSKHEVTGVVDLSRAGVADRHQDITLFLRSFESNTGNKPDFDLFLHHYGLIKKIDEEKLEFYRILDEFF